MTSLLFFSVRTVRTRVRPEKPLRTAEIRKNTVDLLL